MRVNKGFIIFGSFTTYSQLCLVQFSTFDKRNLGQWLRNLLAPNSHKIIVTKACNYYWFKWTKTLNKHGYNNTNILNLPYSILY